MSRILVCDDSVVIAEMLVMTLKLNGHEAKMITNGFSNMLHPEHKAWQDVDVVIMDLMLGEKTTGADLLQVAKTYHPHIRRIVLSAVAELETDRSHLTDLADAVLEKPTGVHEILDVLDD